jgi:CHAT domain-containing protein/tetratricopeptide (TPR) repeat protein
MATRLVGFSVFLLGCSMFLPHANAAVLATSQQATVVPEPSRPQATATVEKMLDDARRLAEAKQPLGSLKAADQALEVARQTGDSAGEALAQQARAEALQDLQRTDEVVAAWQEAARIWAGLGDAPEQITGLVQAGLLCIPDKKSEAERLFAQGLSVGKLKNDRPVAVAQALHDSGIALSKGIPARGFGKPMDKEQKQMAWEYLSAALAMREKQMPDSLSLAETLDALARIAIDRGNGSQDSQYYLQAKNYSGRAAEIGQRLAPDSPIVVESLRALAQSERFLSNDDGSVRSHYLAALQIQKKLAPGGSVEEIEILACLGALEVDLTHYPVAREYLAEAVALGERVAPESKEFEYSLECLGVLEVNEGDPSAARDHLQRAFAIREKLHASLGPTLLYLGAAANDQGDFASARAYFERALGIFQETNPNSPEIPLTLDNLSIAFDRQGDLASALEYSQRALAITEQKEGASPNTARNLGTVGDVLRDQGKFGTAADYYQRSLALWEKLVPDSLDVAYTLERLSTVARAQGNRGSAAEYDRRALEMGQKSCPNSWCVVDIMAELGKLVYEMGDLAAAEGYLLRALKIRETSLGLMHPLLAGNLNDLALTAAAQGKTTEALADALRAERIGAEHLRVSVRTLSERQALAYEGIRASGLDLALTLAGDRASTPSTRSEVFDALIRSRALVFDELAARHRSAYGSGDSEVTQLADQLSSARAQLATLVFRGGDAPSESYRKLLDGAREKKEEAERMLAEKSLAFRQEQARGQLGFKEIVASLPQNTVLVAFVRYGRHDLQKPGANQVPPEPIPSYAAFVIRAGEHEPEFVPLGAAREIDGLLAAWRRDIARQAEVMDLSAKTGESNYRRSGAALRRRIWDPLVPGIGDARKVFVVPDAALHLVNLASLPTGSSQYLIETGPLIHYLSTERDLVPAQSRHGEGILVVGNPAFDQMGKLLMASNRQFASVNTTSGTTGGLLRGARSACGTFQTLRFPPLPASQQEVENIAALWKRSASGEMVQPGGGLQQVTGTDASREAFARYAPGKRVLHVATHGFFLEGSCQSAGWDVDKRDQSSPPATTENPLLLSGLAFAGANRRRSAKTDETDGILTAEEIAGINLDGVDWAVLSACDTGVGEIKVGEGVFGLRRAFQVAGAKTVIMSLWPVEDETTRQWMGTLYREHFLNGKDTGESVRAASLQILRERRAKHQSTHPFYWGAFIAAGDWH